MAVLPPLPISKVVLDLALLNQFPECKVKTADELSVVATSLEAQDKPKKKKNSPY